VGLEPGPDLQAVFKKLDAQGESPAVSRVARGSAQPNPEPDASALEPVPFSVPLALPTDPNAGRVVMNPAPPPPEPLETQIAKTSVSLIDLVRRQSLESKTPFASYVALAMLEALQPGATQTIIDPSTTSGTPLSPEEQRVVEALQSFARASSELPKFASSTDMFKHLAGMSASVERALQMRISAAALATRVLGFGRYAPLPRSAFLQGRSPHFLVYCEIENFACQPLTEQDALRMSQDSGSIVDPGDRVRVELSQELQLFAADGSMAWNQSEQSVAETSRNPRHDFFLTNDVTLPPTLSIGKYSLKIVMRDKISGVQDEVALPLEIVSDGLLAGATP
jgi:hypothetical protein